MSLSGIIFNIQRFSIHDGPGIRTTVFLKGCTLRCFWCHNPEGMHRQPEIQFYPDRCLGDAECARVCPEKAHAFTDDRHVFQRQVCSVCGECVESCYTSALELTGRSLTVDQVMAEVLEDRVFYQRSGGGVTLSGGDPLVQHRFSGELLKRCRQEGLHTALETAANCRWSDLEGLLPFTDLVMMDIKHMDEHRHRLATGVSNRRILENARKLAERGQALIFRTPIVPGVNDTAAEVLAIAGFVGEITQAGVSNGHYAAQTPVLELLPFHRLAAEKYTSLGLEYRLRHEQPPERAKMEELAQAAQAQGIPVRWR